MTFPPSALLEAILEGARHPLLVLSREGVVIEANRAALSWSGAAREAVVGRTLAQLAGWNRPPVTLADGREFSLRQTTFTARLVRALDFFIVEASDTAAVEAEKKHARLVFELANMGVWSWDLASDSVTSQSERGVFGWAPMLKTPRQDLVSRFLPGDGEVLFAEAHAAVASRSGFKVELRANLPGSEETRWIAVTGMVRCDENGTPVRVDGITIDITERKTGELRLRESEALFRSIFENAGIGMALVSPEGVPVQSNPALENLLGYTSAELEKLHFRDFTHPDDIDGDLALYKDLVAGRRRRYQVEKRYIRKDGGVMWARLTVSAVRDAGGNMIFGVGMVEDVSERKRVEQEVLSLSQKLIFTQEQERSRVARELHDGLGQQIAALSIAVANIKRGIPEQDAEARERILRLQQRIGAIAEGVRRISHQLHPAVLELAGIVAALRSYCKQFSADTGIAISLQAPDVAEIPGDVALSLYRIAQEALQNVAKHSRAKEAFVELQRNAAGVVLTVTDRGSGFDAEATAPHAGLGLVSIKERVRLVHGSLSILSTAGEGTVLQVAIPLPQPAREQAGAVAGDGGGA